MSNYFIPNDRIGLQTCQPGIASAHSVLNQLLAQGIEVGWHSNGLRLPQTPLWPEGHYYQNGFSLEASSQARELLEAGGLLFEELPTLPPAQMQLRSLKIALYNGRGADHEFAKPLIEVLRMGGYAPELISDADIRAGKLQQFDVLVVPGSPDAGECYYAGLGDKGYQEIRSFVANRGHYLGICGGAYLPLTSYDSRNPYWLKSGGGQRIPRIWIIGGRAAALYACAWTIAGTRSSAPSLWAAIPASTVFIGRARPSP